MDWIRNVSTSSIVSGGGITLLSSNSATTETGRIAVLPLLNNGQVLEQSLTGRFNSRTSLSTSCKWLTVLSGPNSLMPMFVKC